MAFLFSFFFPKPKALESQKPESEKAMLTTGSKRPLAESSLLDQSSTPKAKRPRMDESMEKSEVAEYVKDDPRQEDYSQQLADASEDSMHWRYECFSQALFC